MSREAEEVTVIVYGARHLPTKKKGKRKYSVIFGVGHSKFRTDVVQDFFGNPDWNNESQIAVDNPDKPLLLVVTEKEEILGQVSLILSDLPRSKVGRQIKARLQPHKKCPEPEGELLYEAWVSKLRAASDSVSLKEHGSSKGTFKKIKGRLSHSPLLRRKFGGSGSSNISVDPSEPLPGMGPTASQSNFELGPNSSSYSNLKGSSSKSMYSINTLGHSSLSTPDSSMHKRYGSFKDLTEEEDKPEVTGVSPREGPVGGGTRVTIRGVNLGVDQADVVGLFICGANCLGSIEYESPRKLYATTKSWKACTGNIVIETQSGGKGTSLVQFTFKESEDKPESAESSPSVVKKSTPTPPPRRTLTPASSNQSLPEAETPKDAQKGPPPPLFTPTLTEETAEPEIIEEPPNLKDKSPPPPLFSPASEQDTPSETIKTEKQKTPPPPLFPFNESEDADRSSKSSDVFYNVDIDTKEADASNENKQGASTFYDITFIEDSKDEDDIPPPEVSGIRPREGPAGGGTQLTIRGKNLGLDKEDIIGLSICGADCLETLQYDSPSKIRCTTKTWRACTGAIIIETQSGGKGTSLVQYTFKQSDPTEDGQLGYAAVTAHQKGTTPPPPVSPAALTEPVYSTYPGASQRGRSPSAGDTSRSTDSRGQSPEVEQNNNVMEAGDNSPTAKPRKKHTQGNIMARLSGSNQDKRQSSPKREMNTDAGTVAPVVDEAVLKKLAEFEKLQAENSALKEQNANMKGYIDDLVSKVIVLCPNALCVDDSGSE